MLIEKYVDIDINLDDVIDYISECDYDELSKIKNNIKFNEDDENMIFVENLYDQEKFNLVKELYENFSLDELKKLTKWKQEKGITVKIK